VESTNHRIDLIAGQNTVNCQPYRAGPRARAVESTDIQRILKAEVIEPATSEWASPIVLVAKPDGSTRFCVDYRRLNAITVRIPIRYRVWMSALTPSEMQRFLRPWIVTLVTRRYQCSPKTGRKPPLLHTKDYTGFQDCTLAYATRLIPSNALWISPCQS
jgi:hypothetical protein